MAQDRVTPPLPSLAGSDWLTRPETKAVFAALNVAGVKTRAVGGAVRNALLGRPVHDIDLATTATPEETARLATQAGLTSIASGLGHGTVTVIANHTAFEVTTLRRDVETDGRHARVAFTDDWRADAGRRDFTINAFYCDADGTVYDPLRAYPDLLARRVRFIGAPVARIREDFLRILRFFRFASDIGGGNLDAAGLAACRAERAGLAQLSRERVRAELLRLLATPHATTVIPQIADDILPLLLPQPPDVALLGRVIAIEHAQDRPADALLRLAALSGARPGTAGALKHALRLSTREFERLARLTMSDPAFAPAAPECEAQAFIYRFGSEAFIDGLLMSWSRSSAPADDAAYKHRLELPHCWQSPTLPLRGSDIVDLGVPPGPRVGQILSAFEDWWIAAGFPSDPAQLASRLAQLAKRPEGDPAGRS